MSGLFITIEGGHGCGKSTIMKMLKAKLGEAGLQVVTSVDQKGTVIGRELRRLNLEQGEGIAVLTEALLIAAARHQNVVEVIKPALLEGKVVIGERYTDAFFVFQGFGRDLPVDLLERINVAVADGVEPEITILLDVDPVIALARIELKEKHRIEKESIAFHRKIRAGYLEQATKHPERIKVFDASLPPEKVFANVWSEVLKILKGELLC